MLEQGEDVMFLFSVDLKGVRCFSAPWCCLLPAPPSSPHLRVSIAHVIPTYPITLAGSTIIVDLRLSLTQVFPSGFCY